MFSDHLPKIDQAAGRNLLVIAGSLVMVCQLVAMVVVTDGQVKKAQARESQMQSQRQIVAQCLESAKGAALSTCTARVYADNRQPTTLNQVDDSSEDRRITSASRSTDEGLMSTSFAAR